MTGSTYSSHYSDSELGGPGLHWQHNQLIKVTIKLSTEHVIFQLKYPQTVLKFKPDKYRCKIFSEIKVVEVSSIR